MSINISSGNILNSLYNNSNGDTSFYTGSYTRERNVSDKNIEASMALTKDMKRTIKKLEGLDFDMGVSTDSLKYVSKLVEGYNDITDSSGNRRYSKKVTEFEELFDKHSEELEKVGVKVENGKAYLDAEEFVNAKADDFKKVFSSNSKFMKSVNNLVYSMNNSIKNDVLYTLNENISVNNTVDSKNIAIADSVNSVVMTLNELMNTKLSDDGSNASYISELLSKYGECENKFWNSISENIDADFSNKAIEDINKIIELNDQLYEDTSDYNSLFKDDGKSYGSKISALYKDLFSEIVGASDKNFVISNFVDYKI